MITLKIEKAICPGCDVKNSNRAFCRQLWRSFLLKIKIERKRKSDSFFNEKITVKHLKIVRSSDPRVRL